MISLIWFVPLLPLIGFLIIGLARNILSKNVAAVIGCGVILFSFIISCIIFCDVYAARQLGGDGSFPITVFEWFKAGSVNVSLSFLVDPLSSIMLLIVTGIGF